ncbi:hypothetical protein STEG23_004146 [Scotinomys teguina]
MFPEFNVKAVLAHAYDSLFVLSVPKGRGYFKSCLNWLDVVVVMNAHTAPATRSAELVMPVNCVHDESGSLWSFTQTSNTDVRSPQTEASKTMAHKKSFLLYYLTVLGLLSQHQKTDKHKPLEDEPGAFG